MAYQFKEGDIVTVTSECTGTKLGKEYRLMRKFPDGWLYAVTETDSNGNVWRGCSCQEKWQLVENKLTNNNMNKLKTLFTRLVSPDVAKLSEAGFLNGDLALTNEAREELMNILFLEKKAELLKLAEEILEKRKEEKK